MRGDVLLSFYSPQIVAGVLAPSSVHLSLVSIVVYEAQPETKARAFGFASVHDTQRGWRRFRTTFRARCCEAHESRFDSLRSVTWKRTDGTSSEKQRRGVRGLTCRVRAADQYSSQRTRNTVRFDGFTLEGWS